jgi:hypothetical protein
MFRDEKEMSLIDFPLTKALQSSTKAYNYGDKSLKLWRQKAYETIKKKRKEK